MNRTKKIIISLLILLISAIVILLYRYNLSFGDSFNQKTVMAICMNKVLKTNDHKESKRMCECMVGGYVEKFSEKELLYISQKSLQESFNNCNSEKENLIAENIQVDSTKLYQKIGWINQIDENTKEDVEAYVSKKSDTIINQFKVYKNGVIDFSMSKFYELKIEGYKDSLIQGEIRFFSPKDSISLDKIENRDVIFYYLQRENDSLIIKEIKTDTNYIKFPYRNFDNYTFVGFISDYRWITVDTSEVYLLNRNLFAIDSEASTNNNFVELIK